MFPGPANSRFWTIMPDILRGSEAQQRITSSPQSLGTSSSCTAYSLTGPYYAFFTIRHLARIAAIDIWRFMIAADVPRTSVPARRSPGLRPRDRHPARQLGWDRLFLLCGQLFVGSATEGPSHSRLCLDSDYERTSGPIRQSGLSRVE